MELTDPQASFPDLLDKLRLIVEPDLTWVLKNLKTTVRSPFWPVWFIPTNVPSTLPLLTIWWISLTHISLRQGFSNFLKTWPTPGRHSFVKNTRWTIRIIPCAFFSSPPWTRSTRMNMDSRRSVFWLVFLNFANFDSLYYFLVNVVFS